MLRSHSGIILIYKDYRYEYNEGVVRLFKGGHDIPHWFNIWNPIMEAHFRFWIDFGCPEPWVFDFVTWSNITLTPLARTAEEHNVEQGDLDQLRLFWKLRRG